MNPSAQQLDDWFPAEVTEADDSDAPTVYAAKEVAVHGDRAVSDKVGGRVITLLNPAVAIRGGPFAVGDVVLARTARTAGGLLWELIPITELPPPPPPTVPIPYTVPLYCYSNIPIDGGGTTHGGWTAGSTVIAVPCWPTSPTVPTTLVVTVTGGLGAWACFGRPISVNAVYTPGVGMNPPSGWAFTLTCPGGAATISGRFVVCCSYRDADGVVRAVLGFYGTIVSRASVDGFPCGCATTFQGCQSVGGASFVIGTYIYQGGSGLWSTAGAMIQSGRWTGDCGSVGMILSMPAALPPPPSSPPPSPLCGGALEGETLQFTIDSGPFAGTYDLLPESAFPNTWSQPQIPLPDPNPQVFVYAYQPGLPAETYWAWNILTLAGVGGFNITAYTCDPLLVTVTTGGITGTLTGP